MSIIEDVMSGRIRIGMTIEEIRDSNAYELATIADVPSPDLPNSPGAEFLLSVASDTADYLENEHYDEDSPWEIADSCVPVYTHNLWLTFVDLAAYQEDVTELGYELGDLTKAAGVALYMIGERLVRALADEYEETGDKDENE